MISFDTSYAIAAAHQEIERAEKLLADVEEGLRRGDKIPDVRDAFGRQQRGLQLGVPSGPSCHQLYHLDWNLCIPVLTAHIGSTRAKLAALCEVARSEMLSPTP